MSGSQKAVLAGLALIVFAFVALVLWGQQRPDCEGRDGDCASRYEPEGAVKWIGERLAGAGPQAELPGGTVSIASSGRREFAIGPADERLRTLKLELLRGRAALRFENLQPEPGLELGDQAEPTLLPREATDPQQRTRLAFAVTRGGGRLTVDCVGPPCELRSR